MRAIPVRILVAAPPSFLESERGVVAGISIAVLGIGVLLSFAIGLPWGSAVRLMDAMVIGGGLLHLVGCRSYFHEGGSKRWGLWFAGIGMMWLALAWDPAAHLKTWDHAHALTLYAALIACGMRTCWTLCLEKSYLAVCGGCLFWTAHVWLLISNSKTHFAGVGVLESWIL